MKERIGIDCDGVLANLMRYAVDKANRKRGDRYYTVLQSRAFDIEESYDKAFVKFFYDLLREPKTWGAPAPYPGVGDYTRTLAQRYEIYVITAMPAEFLKIRCEWLARHEIPFDNCLSVEHGDLKVRMAKELGLVAFIEDKPTTAHQMASAGIESYMIRRPWNAQEILPGVKLCSWPQAVNALMDRPVLVAAA